MEPYATKPKKKKGGQWINKLILWSTGILSGVLVIKYMNQKSPEQLPLSDLALNLAILWVCLLAAMLLQTIIHETGHLVFGLLTGYRFSSFRILSLMWLKADDRVQFKHMRIPGTAGQCLMAPPNLQDGKMPVLLYNLGGVIMNTITAILCLCFSFLCPRDSFAWLLLAFSALVGFAFALTNGLPIQTGVINNDGRNALSCFKNEEATRALWIQLKSTEQNSKGIRLREMPEDWFAFPSDESMKNGIIAFVGVLACNRLMDERRFAEADALMEHLLSLDSGIAGLHRGQLTCDRMYVELMTQNRPDVLNEMRTKDQLKLMKALGRDPSVLRTEFAYTLLVEKDQKKADRILKLFEKVAASFPYQGEIQGERELLELTKKTAE